MFIFKCVVLAALASGLVLWGTHSQTMFPWIFLGVVISRVSRRR
jgi:hypothetical protein